MTPEDATQFVGLLEDAWPGRMTSTMKELWAATLVDKCGSATYFDARAALSVMAGEHGRRPGLPDVVTAIHVATRERSPEGSETDDERLDRELAEINRLRNIALVEYGVTINPVDDYLLLAGEIDLRTGKRIDRPPPGPDPRTAE